MSKWWDYSKWPCTRPSEMASCPWKELQDVVLDVEVALNIRPPRPLSYLEDDIQFPVLTPNTFLFEQPKLPLVGTIPPRGRRY